MKGRLVESLNKATVIKGVYTSDGKLVESYRVKAVDYEIVPHLADHLIDDGIVAPPVKVGQTVWVYNQSTKNIYKNKVVCIKIIGASKYKNKITVEYTNQHGEKSCRKFTWAQIGKQVFLTEEEAVEALAKGVRDESITVDSCDE